nr:hypothetical protein [Marinicella sp. W31]MDC2878873.1 hypothetical protein [Marinicella sp. W31]
MPVARAEDIYAGPVRAEVVRVIDGDTIVVQARPWPGQIVETSVRIRGVDTPELRSSCNAERQAASIARDYVVSLLHAGETVQLRQIAGDKYFGRVVADVMLPDERDLSYLLLEGASPFPMMADASSLSSVPRPEDAETAFQWASREFSCPNHTNPSLPTSSMPFRWMDFRSRFRWLPSGPIWRFR